ncbi:MAG TPA: EndoU domain-containing protein [Blastocatellia bacterium]|nr:EndoU domain-containing protein [Blastocatellia bacterium]
MEDKTAAPQGPRTHHAALFQRAGRDPRSLTPRDVLQLQRAVGNRAVGQLLAPAARREPPPQKANATGLPDDLKTGVENLSGVSLDGLRVHYNSPRPAEVGALAYTQGTEIHVAPGQERHLAHEAWHVVQQKRGRVKPTMQMKGGVKVNDDPALEQEADQAGAKVSQRKVMPLRDDGVHARLSNNAPVIQRTSAKQGWDVPALVKTHIFDGEADNDNLKGFHSEARKKTTNGKLQYSEATAANRNETKPYGAEVRVKIGESWSPKNNEYKSSDLFPAGWNEAKVTEAIEMAYDSTFTYTPSGASIGHRLPWRAGKWLGNGKGVGIVFVGHPPTTIYPRR